MQARYPSLPQPSIPPAAATGRLGRAVGHAILHLVQFNPAAADGLERIRRARMLLEAVEEVMTRKAAS